MHWDLTSGMGCCRLASYFVPQVPYSPAREWGEYLCDTPAALVEGSFQWVQKNLPDIDFILYTGDTASHNIPFQTPWGNLDSILTLGKWFQQ